MASRVNATATHQTIDGCFATRHTRQSGLWAGATSSIRTSLSGSRAMTVCGGYLRSHEGRRPEPPRSSSLGARHRGTRSGAPTQSLPTAKVATDSDRRQLGVGEILKVTPMLAIASSTV